MMNNQKIENLLNEINKISNNKSSIDYESIEKKDKIKSRLLKYIFYKKRSEQEVKNKFSKDYDEETLDEVIDELKRLGYIDDSVYIERSINEFKALKKLSLKEVKYKLLSKGVSSKDIDKFFENNYDDLMEYEKQSAISIFIKKSRDMDEQQIKNYLYKKGYKEESIKEAENAK